MYSSNIGINTFQPLRRFITGMCDEITLSDLADFTSLPKRRLEKFVDTGIISERSVDQILRSFDLTIANLAPQSLDVGAGVLKLKGNRCVVPVKYLENPRTSRALVKVMLDALNPETKKLSLQFMQTSEKLFDNENIGKKISTKFTHDLFHFLAIHFNFNENALVRLGYNVYQNMPYTRKASREILPTLRKTAAEMFSTMLKNYEKNHYWELDDSKSSVMVIRKHPTEETRHDLISNKTNTNEVCIYMKGMMESTILNSMHLRVNISEEKCIFRGDDYCEYHLAMGSAQKVHLFS